LIVLDFSGTNLETEKKGSTTMTIPSEITDPNLISGDSRDAKSNDLLVVVVSLVATATLASIGLIIFFSKRRAYNRRHDRKKETTDVHEMSMLGSQKAGVNKFESGELVFISNISAGAFGDVWKGTYKGNAVAIKKMKLERMPKDQLRFMQSVLTEAKIMREMVNERVVQFIAFDFRAVSIVMELMPCGALSSFIEENNNNMLWSTRYQMMIDICEGMAFLHSSVYADGSEKDELFHQDLKSANVLLIEVEGIIRAKIGDFGLSCMLP
jgi:hypothetical protein